MTSNPTKIGDNPRRGNHRAVDADLHIGDIISDGTIYAGVSPDTGKPLYAAPADAPLTMTFNEAQKLADRKNVHKALGHDDWRIPTKDELNLLFNNRAAISGFNLSGSAPSGYYWSSSSGDKCSAGCQRFSDGRQFEEAAEAIRDDHATLRLVR